MYSRITIGLNPQVPLPIWLAQHVLNGSIATTQDKIIMSFCYQEPTIDFKNLYRLPSTIATRKKWLRFHARITQWLATIPNERYHYQQIEEHQKSSFSREYGNPYYQFAIQAEEEMVPSWNSIRHKSTVQITA